MQASHIIEKNTTNNVNNSKALRKIETAYNNFVSSLDELKLNKNNISYEEQEEIIVRLSHDIGKAGLSEILSSKDINSTSIKIEDETYRHKHRAKRTYQTSLGPVSIERHVYVNRKKNGSRTTVCPLELSSGIVESYWTPSAAKKSAWALAHLTPQELEDILLRFGAMNPSRSSLERLPKILLNQWEPKNIENYGYLMSEEEIPENAVAIAVSLDGVMIAMKPEKADKNQSDKRRVNWREASCGTISFIDSDGEKISTIQYGQMPEHKKATLKNLLKKNVEVILKKKSSLKVVYVADGAQDNWTFIEEALPHGIQNTDFYHACQYLKSAFNAAYPDVQEKACTKFKSYKKILRDEAGGISKTLRALRNLRSNNKTNKEISAAVTYFTNNQHRMKYFEIKEKKLPIGSGIVEAACKTLVGQRMKRSGMSWSHYGGNSILNLRAITKSHRFDSAWKLMINKYKKEGIECSNVIPMFD